MNVTEGLRLNPINTENKIVQQLIRRIKIYNVSGYTVYDIIDNIIIQYNILLLYF